MEHCALTKIFPIGTAVYSGIWSFAEISVGIVAACLPTLGVIFTRKRFSGSATSYGKRMLSTLRSRFSNKTSPSQSQEHQSVSLREFPRGYKVWASVVPTVHSSGEEVGSRPFTKLSTETEEDRKNKSENLPAQVHEGEGDIYVKNEVHQEYSLV